MSHKSLAEAAQEVLNKSRADAPKEGIKHEPAQPASTGEVDVGGATYENPQGPAVGKITAAARPVATPPGTQPDPSSDEKIKTLPNQPGSEGSGIGHAKVAPVDLNGSQSHDYVHPTSEAVELTAEEVAAAEADKVARIKEQMKSVGVAEDITAILSGETFSEDFKTKLTTIFEAAVISRAVLVVEKMEDDILAAAEESVDEIKEEIERNVDAYLTTMVEEWKNENKIAVESGLKTEIVEEFLEGLKKLFVENYIELPSEKVDVVSALSAEVSELTEKLNNSMNANVDLVKRINEARKVEVAATVCEGLTATQAAKVKTLAEGVEFTTEGEYTQKLKVIRESYFNSNKGGKAAPTQVALVETANEPVAEPVQAPKLDPRMAAYVDAIR